MSKIKVTDIISMPYITGKILGVRTYKSLSDGEEKELFLIGISSTTSDHPNDILQTNVVAAQYKHFKYTISSEEIVKYPQCTWIAECTVQSLATKIDVDSSKIHV